MGEWTRGRAVGAACAALVLGMLPGAAAGSAGEPEAGSDGVGTAAAAVAGPVRIAILGDSISHGSSGDYTWRYFLDRHLRAAGVGFDLVGPRDDLHDLATAGGVPSHDYVDPGFDTGHAARWGARMGSPAVGVPDLMAGHAPDVLVIGLGTNDLLYGQTPAVLLQLLRERIEEARTVVPAVRVVVVEVTALHAAGAADYNRLLGAAAPSWSTATSPVVVARASDGFVAGTPTTEGDTWDPVHPDTSGSVKIAAAVGDALAAMGVGTPYARPLRVPAEGLRRSSLVDAAAVAGGAAVWWLAAPGATAHDVWARDVTVGSASAPARTAVTGTMTQVLGLVPGHEYAFRVLPRKGFHASQPDVLSNEVRVVVPGGVVPPAVQPPGEVAGLRLRARRDALLAAWEAVPGATGYLVAVRPVGGAWVAQEAARPGVVLRGLRSGALHEVVVRALGAAGAGAPSATAVATPRGPRPAAPARLRAVRRPGHRVLLSWAPSRHATHYTVDVRRVRPGARWRRVQVPTESPVRRVLVRGVGRGVHEFRVRAHHDDLAGRGVARVRR